MTLLNIRDLRVDLRHAPGPVEAVRGVSFTLGASGWGSSAKAGRARP
jgi:ABC-type dipeptide/oligopeptide/nickel transport system ATPase component